MKLAIVGSRTFDDYGMLACKIHNHFYLVQIREIISGGANGADSLAKKYARQHLNIKYTEFPADWNKHGKAAGFIRNQQIVDACDTVLAFWDGKSAGTKDTIERAKRAKKSTFIVYF